MRWRRLGRALAERQPSNLAFETVPSSRTNELDIVNTVRPGADGRADNLAGQGRLGGDRLDDIGRGVSSDLGRTAFGKSCRWR
jgi:hypothetical protein